MKKYEIEINNEVYRVSVKELPADADMSSKANAPNEETQPDTATASTPTEVTSEPSTSGDGTKVTAPMAGTILSISVSPGQEVAKGETLIILEAMKMENEIVAPQDGVVGGVFVSVNERVESDHVLLTI